MGRSVDYLNKALQVSYFQWPLIESYNDETDEFEQTDEFEEGYIVTEDIQECIICEFPEFDRSKKWDGRETSIILKGYGTEIGLSEYCGLASLSIRIDENELDYNDYDEAEYNEQYDKILSWINENWARISAGYSQFNKVATFSNGEAIFEKNNK